MRKAKTNHEFGRGGELNTIVGKGTLITGDMQVQNSLRIDGKVKGNIRVTDTIVVGKEGEVDGNVHAKHLFLAGTIKGNVTASGRVFLESTASVLGDITATRLIIDEGALFDGKCAMKGTGKMGGGSRTNIEETKKGSPMG